MQEIKSYLGWKVDYLNPPGEPAFAGPDRAARVITAPPASRWEKRIFFLLPSPLVQAGLTMKAHPPSQFPANFAI